MVYLPGHKLHNVEVVRTEADEKGEEDEENNGVGPMIPPGSTGYRVLLGCGSQLQVDLGVAACDDDEGTVEGDGTGQKQDIRGEVGALEVEVLHAGSSSMVLVQHAAEQQRSYLQGYQKPDQAADPANHPHTPQTLESVWMHHGQVSVQTDTGHEANTWWTYNENVKQHKTVIPQLCRCFLVALKLILL